MFSELIFFCGELENFIYKNQIQEFSDENDDAYYAEQFWEWFIRNPWRSLNPKN